MKISIRPNKAGIPNNPTTITVIILIGIIMFKGAAIRLYPYITNKPKINFLITLNIFFNINFTLVKDMKGIIYLELEIRFRSSKASSK